MSGGATPTTSERGESSSLGSGGAFPKVNTSALQCRKANQACPSFLSHAGGGESSGCWRRVRGLRPHPLGLSAGPHRLADRALKERSRQ